MVELVIPQRGNNLGRNMEVGRIVPFAKSQMAEPFIFFDGIESMDVPVDVDRAAEVRPLPHIGLAAVARFDAPRRLGYAQAVLPAEVNWMTAGTAV